MSSIPAYNAYAEEVLMPAMDQDALAEIKRLEAAESFWAVETVRDSDAIRYMRHPREYDGATIAYTSKAATAEFQLGTKRRPANWTAHARPSTLVPQRLGPSSS